MSTLYKKLVQTILDKWPLQKQFGFYAFLPAFFLIGAWSEFVMIHMRINGIDFYSIYLKKQQEKLQQERERLDKILDVKKTELQLQQQQQQQKSDSISPSKSTT